MSEYNFLSLEQSDIAIIDGDRGKNYPSPEDFVEKGFCLFLNTKNVRENGFDFSNAQFISKEKDDNLRKGKLQRNDIVLTTRGTLGNIGFYNQTISYNHIRINSGMVILRCGQNIDPKFIYLFLKSSIFKNQVQSFQSGSAQPQLPIKDLKCILIPDLVLSEQKQIADILSCLDNKIDNLHRQNETLEKIAQTLFKHWFIDFEFPNDDGKPYKSAGGAMVASELGDIPAGWCVGKFSTFFHLLNGGTPKTSIAEYWNGNIKWLSVKDVTKNNRQFIIDTEKTITEKGLQKSAAKLLPKFTTIVSARGTVGNYCLLSEEMAISQSSFGVYPNLGNYVFFGYLLMSSLIQKLRSQAYGSVFDTVTVSTFNGLNIVLPELSFIKEFEFKINPIFQKQLLNKHQIQTLTKTRDTLLPKLMSGQIRVKQIESLIEEVK